MLPLVLLVAKEVNKVTWNKTKPFTFIFSPLVVIGAIGGELSLKMIINMPL